MNSFLYENGGVDYSSTIHGYSRREAIVRSSEKTKILSHFVQFKHDIDDVAENLASGVGKKRKRDVIMKKYG